MNKFPWYALYCEACDAYNTVFAQQGRTPEWKAELTRIRDIKSVILDYWFALHGKTVTQYGEAGGKFEIVQIGVGRFAWRFEKTKLYVAYQVGATNWGSLVVPAYIPSRDKEQKDG